MLSYCAFIWWKSHTLSSVSSYRAFYSLDNFKIISDLRSFQKSDNFSESFASISLNANVFCMQIYHNQKLLFLLISVKLEYCENLKKIRCLNFRQFSRGFKTSMDFLTWWFRHQTHRKIVHNFFLKIDKYHLCYRILYLNYRCSRASIEEN